jgi:hypothetical protein
MKEQAISTVKRMPYIEKGTNLVTTRRSSIRLPYVWKEPIQQTTRDCVPLHWVRTQMNLGTALQALGEREIGTARLEQAVTAFEACLAVTASVWPVQWVRYVQTHRDETMAEIARRSAK